MNSLKNLRLSRLIPSLTLILIGLVFLCVPGLVFAALGYIVGGALIFFGVMQIVPSLISRKVMGFSLVIGCFFTVLGILILRFHTAILEMIFIVIGIVILLDGLFKLISALPGRRLGQKDWLFVLIWAILVTACGVLVIINPFHSSHVVVIVLGLSVLLDGVQNLYAVLRQMLWGKGVAENKTAVRFAFFRSSEEISAEPIQVEGEVEE